VTVDELHAEDLGGREGGLSRDSKTESLSLRNLLSILCKRKEIDVSEWLLDASTIRTLAIETRVSRAHQIKLTAAKPVPRKAWSERRARERNPKRVILRVGGIGGEGKEEEYTRRK
jgi:hypothetical protein